MSPEPYQPAPPGAAGCSGSIKIAESQADAARQLLSAIAKHYARWHSPGAWEPRTKYAEPEFAEFVNHLPDRASAMAARVVELEAQLGSVVVQLHEWRQRYAAEIETMRAKVMQQVAQAAIHAAWPACVSCGQPSDGSVDGDDNPLCQICKDNLARRTDA